MKLVMVDGKVKGGCYFSEDSYVVWQGTPGELPLKVVKDALDGLEEWFPEVYPAPAVWADLTGGEDTTAAQEPVDILGSYYVCELQWRED